MTPAITVRRGDLYLSSEIYESYFAGLTGVVLQRRGVDLLMLPVRHPPSGGYLLKHRNARGDRVVSAGDFFRAQEIENHTEIQAPIRRDTSEAGLLLGNIFGQERERT